MGKKNKLSGKSVQIQDSQICLWNIFWKYFFKTWAFWCILKSSMFEIDICFDGKIEHLPVGFHLMNTGTFSKLIVHYWIQGSISIDYWFINLKYWCAHFLWCTVHTVQYLYLHDNCTAKCVLYSTGIQSEVSLQYTSCMHNIYLPLCTVSLTLMSVCG